jgi:hypothetical protein
MIAVAAVVAVVLVVLYVIMRPPMVTQTPRSSGQVSVNQTTIPTSSVSQLNLTPALVPVAEEEVTVNASRGTTASLGNIILVIRPGTYVKDPGGDVLSVYNVSIIDYGLVNVKPTPNGYRPVYAFAYAVNGKVSPGYTFVDSHGSPRPVVTVVWMPDTWTTWTWLGFAQEPNGTLVGGAYAFQDEWVYAGSGLWVNFQFVKPVPWVFVDTGMESEEEVTYTAPVIDESYTGPALVPVGIGTIDVNASIGGAVAVGNILAVVLPGTYVQTPSGSILGRYNFSLVYQAVHDLEPLGDYLPLFSYAFAVNGQMSTGYTFVNSYGNATMPVITIAFLPPGSHHGHG